MDYSIASVVCAASFAGFLVLFALYSRTARRLKLAEAGLDAKSRGLHDLVAENLELDSELDRLRKIEIEFYALQRDHARARNTLNDLARAEAGLRLEVTRLQERQAVARAAAAAEPAPFYSPQAA